MREVQESTKLLSPANYLRHLAQCGFVERLGSQICWMLSVIATTQLIRDVKQDVRIYDTLLMMQSGLTSIEELHRCRDIAVAEKVLRFVPGDRPGLAIYWLIFSNTAEVAAERQQEGGKP